MLALALVGLELLEADDLVLVGEEDGLREGKRGDCEYLYFDESGPLFFLGVAHGVDEVGEEGAVVAGLM